MNRFLFRFCIFIALVLVLDRSFAFAEESVPSELSLKQCYERALRVSETLGRRDQDIQIAQAQYDQTLAVLFPNIQFGSSQRWRDSAFRRSGGSSGENGGGSGGGSNNKNQFETVLNLSQPLFTGFRNIYYAKSAEAQIRASSFERRRTAELLYSDVADLFYQIQQYQKGLLILDRTRASLVERVAELKKFIILGRSRESELLAAQASIADSDSNRERVRGLLGASREMMAFLLNVPVNEVKLKQESAPLIAASLEAFLAQVTKRYDIQAAKELEFSAQKQFDAAERLGWPTLSLEGDYYPYDDPDNGRSAEAYLRFSLPLYEGGSLQAQAAEQQAKLRSSKLNVQESQRIAEREVRIAYNDFSSAMAEISELKKFLASTQKNYESQRRDYQLGVVTNLEVLQAIQSVQEAERRLLDAEITAQVTLIRLQVSAGGIE